MKARVRVHAYPDGQMAVFHGPRNSQRKGDKAPGQTGCVNRFGQPNHTCHPCSPTAPRTDRYGEQKRTISMVPIPDNYKGSRHSCSHAVLPNPFLAVMLCDNYATKSHSFISFAYLGPPGGSALQPTTLSIHQAILAQSER